jgi:DNA adenine methylase
MPSFHRPFLKWAGGKFRLLSFFLKNIQTERPIFVEPFVGAGSIFLNWSASSYYLNDSNADLIALYRVLKERPLEFIKDAEPFFQKEGNVRAFYEQSRARFNASSNPYERAVLLLYLNRHGYNGLCRYNRKGFYNVPFGAYKRPYFPLKEMLYYASYKEKAKWRIEREDFESFLMEVPRRKALIYCDPPYAPLTEKHSFTAYIGQPFGWEQQEILARRARLLARQGAIVVLSNHDTEAVRHLYKGARILHVQVRRSVSAGAAQRTEVPELLAIFE